MREGEWFVVGAMQDANTKGVSGSLCGYCGRKVRFYGLKTACTFGAGGRLFFENIESKIIKLRL